MGLSATTHLIELEPHQFINQGQLDRGLMPHQHQIGGVEWCLKALTEGRGAMCDGMITCCVKQRDPTQANCRIRLARQRANIRYEQLCYQITSDMAQINTNEVSWCPELDSMGCDLF